MTRQPESRDWPRWLITGWLIAGTFDITYAITYSFLRRGVAPSRVLQSVASGALGPSAYQGGASTAALGLAFHYLFAFIFTCAFFLAASRLSGLARRPIVSGVVYGIGIFAVMNYIVIPLSRIGPRPTPAMLAVLPEILVHMFLIGVPIALAARRAFGEARSSPLVGVPAY
jgi:hypothetical protein